MRKTLKAMLAGVAMSVVATAAPALEIIDESEYGSNIDVPSLMQPLAPLMNNSAGSTTNILQIGDNHFATSGIEGKGSLALISQEGSRNRAVQAIQGNNTALLLVQGGSDNNVLQVSNGNNNLQLVGVSGNSNNVAYIQNGNNLGGVLQVGGSNSNVLMLQDQRSANFLMPARINNLNNATVVIVPGRMYVMPHR